MKPAGYFRTLNEIDPPTRSPSIRALPSPSRISLWRALQIDLAGVRARDGEQRIHQARQPMGLLKHAPHHVAVFFAATIFLESRFAHAADGGQVSAQLMGCIGSEALQLLKGLLQPAEIGVEDARQMPQLIVVILGGQPSWRRSDVIRSSCRAMSSTGASARCASL